MLKYVPLDWLVYMELRYIKHISYDLKTQQMCNEAN